MLRFPNICLHSFKKQSTVHICDNKIAAICEISPIIKERTESQASILSRLDSEIFIFPQFFETSFTSFVILNPSCECNVNVLIFNDAPPVNAPFFKVFVSLQAFRYGSKIWINACDLPVPGLPRLAINEPLVSGLILFFRMSFFH